MTDISNIASAVSIILGLYAIYQSCKYNKNSDKLNKDTIRRTREWIHKQNVSLVMLRDFKKTANVTKDGKNYLDLSKDELKVRKLNTYKENKIDFIINKINEFSPIAKLVYIESVQAFLNLDEGNEKIITLRRTVSKEDLDKILELNNALEEYGVELEFILVWNS